MGLLSFIAKFAGQVLTEVLKQKKYPFLITVIESYQAKGWTLLSSNQFTAQLTKDGVFSQLTLSLSTNEDGNIIAIESGLFGGTIVYNKPLNLKKPAEWLQDLEDMYPNQPTEDVVGQSNPDAFNMFFTSLLQMAAKIAKSDGVVSKKEINILEELFDSWQLNSKQKKIAIDIFNIAKDSTSSIDEYAENCLKDSPTDDQLSGLIEVLFMIASADGAISHFKEELISRIAKIVHFSGLHYEAIRNKYTLCEDIESHYAVLECKSTDTNEQIKKSYRRLASEYHPDKILHLKLHKDFEKLAHEKFAAIQNAYEIIKKVRQGL